MARQYNKNSGVRANDKILEGEGGRGFRVSVGRIGDRAEEALLKPIQEQTDEEKKAKREALEDYLRSQGIDPAEFDSEVEMEKAKNQIAREREETDTPEGDLELPARVHVEPERRRHHGDDQYPVKGIGRNSGGY